MNRKEYLAKIDEVISKGKYKDNWDSLAGRQMPSWMHKGKLGIFIHWGIYSVPSFGSEWYSRNMYIQGSPEYEHHIKTYGPHNKFGYKDFIPMFKAEKFNPEEWAELFEQAGAKYCVPVAEHHDGFQMYRSELSHWNAYEMGPKRDVLGELGAALSKHGIVNGASSHRIEHWFFMGNGRKFDSDIKDPMDSSDLYWPAMPEADHMDSFSTPVPSQEFLEDWLLRSCEIVDRYQPKQFYFDWWIHHSSARPYLQKFAAYYYNRAEEWGQEVTICYKLDSFAYGTATIDIERGKFSQATPFQWQTCTAIAYNSWCWTENNRFKSSQSILCDLVDIVSKNGVLLLNVGPKPDGTISEEDRKVLLEIGSWLRINGEAIYNTTVWRWAEEGPTKSKEGQFTDSEDIRFTAEDIRFTANGSRLYATVLQWPKDGRVTIKSLAKKDDPNAHVFLGIIKDVEVLGTGKVNWTRDANGLHVSGPCMETSMPVVVKISIL